MALVEEMNDPIDVVTVFRDGTVAPVKFRWAGRTYPVTRVAFRWVTREGAYPVHHFSVACDDDALYEILLNTQTMQWSLVKVQMDG